MEMHKDNKSILIISTPFAETSIPSIQIALFDSYLNSRNINIKTKNFYLDAAEIYGLDNYNYLITSPNDPYVAQMVFSKYLFPVYWNKNRDKFRYFYENIIGYNKEFLENFSFERYIKQSNYFLKHALDSVDYNCYDIIGFSLNYGQFLPSLALSKKIKEKYPNKTIVMGGSSTINELGKKILKNFEWIDFIVSGEGEEALFLLSSNLNNYEKIPGLIYRKNKDVIWNINNKFINLDFLPYLEFNSYYQDLNKVSDEIQQYFKLYGRLPIELSRGCWWNNCSFCNICAYNKKYREKSINRFVEELVFLSDKYKILEFQIIGNTLPINDFKKLCKNIIQIDKDFNLYIESRAGRLKFNDYSLLKQAGFKHIQTGIETLSSNYLKKMNKGTKIIDNLAALKYCKENHIQNSYNFIIDYPNEEKIDFNETQKNIGFIQKYIEPPNISKYVVTFQSPIYNNLEKYNIKNLESTVIDTIMYPKNIRDENISFFYSFKRKQEIKENPWKQLISNWKNIYNQQKILALKKNTDLEKLVFYFIDGVNFIKIYDKRINNNAMIYILNKEERKIFLECRDIKSLSELKENLKDINACELEKTLDSFVRVGILYKENELFLALPISYHQYYNNESIKNDINIEQIRVYVDNL
jgi:ribosomal peptide maturation radical SAM protein 1